MPIRRRVLDGVRYFHQHGVGVSSGEPPVIVESDRVPNSAAKAPVRRPSREATPQIETRPVSRNSRDLVGDPSSPPPRPRSSPCQHSSGRLLLRAGPSDRPRDAERDEVTDPRQACPRQPPGPARQENQNHEVERGPVTHTTPTLTRRSSAARSGWTHKAGTNVRATRTITTVRLIACDASQR